MLVFISDLHFVDESAGKHNIPASAFKKFLESIKVDAVKAKTNEVKIIFLGDIFDLLRTEEWFKEQEIDRPWGDGTLKMRERAVKIMDLIKAKNADTFKLFKPGSIKDIFGDIDVETIYIPGNHDRLCWLVDDLKQKTIELLGLNADNKQNFQHHFSSTIYGVHALHGHSFDKFNYEGGPDCSDDDYKLVPIGDVITTELIARLPYQLMRNLSSKCDLDPAQLENLKRNFQEIENVRPFSATLKWLLYQVQSNRKIKHIIEETVDEVIQGFNEIKFVQKWYDRHDKWYNPFDSADQIQGVLYFLEKFKVFSMNKLCAIADKISALVAEDELTQGAADMFANLDNRIQYIVMGHSHDPKKSALGVNRDAGVTKERVYLNTGTWRKRYHACECGNSFIGWKDMTYVIFYTKDEKPNLYNLPVFETWTGSLKRDE